MARSATQRPGGQWPPSIRVRRRVFADALCERVAIASGRDMKNYSQTHSGRPLYVCNCNGLRQRDVAQAIEAGATRPRDVFVRHQCAAQCAKCVCEMRQMIQESRQAFAMAAE
jgi:bacterioferritin-associated ferredoxin